VRLVLLGPPGAGKGTQAARIAQRHAVPHISTGDIFREHVKGSTELGIQAQEYINRGHLVPDDVVNRMIGHRLVQPDAEHGWLLDGYPRTVPQAEALEKLLESLDQPLEAVLWFEVPEDEFIRRIQSRAEQGGRSDDTEEAVRRRIEEYVQKTALLEDFYRDRGLLRYVDGVGMISEVADRTLCVLKTIEKGVGGGVPPGGREIRNT
jgi:adenylate kinase